MSKLKANALFMINALQLIVIVVGTSEYSSFHPCKVDKVILQPYFGISARTKKLVDILQVPPLLTQKIHADICAYSNTHQLHRIDKPRFICRQRYSVVEVYSKTREDIQGFQGLQSFIKVPGEQLANDFVKDFVVIESGCDVFINFRQVRVLSSNEQEKALKKTMISGVASLHGVGESSRETQAQASHNFHNPVSAYSSDSRSNSLKSRSMIRSDFFRKGFHLNLEPVATSLNSTELPSTQGKPSFPKNEATTQDNSSVPEGEIRLTPENIGLPLLILESSIDPVMKIISKSIK